MIIFHFPGKSTYFYYGGTVQTLFLGPDYSGHLSCIVGFGAEYVPFDQLIKWDTLKGTCPRCDGKMEGDNKGIVSSWD